MYLAEKGAYRAVEVELLARNPDEVAVKGIPAGAMVTLVDASVSEKEGGLKPGASPASSPGAKANK